MAPDSNSHFESIRAVGFWAIFQRIIIESPIGNNPTSDCVLIILGLIFVIGFGIGIPFLMYTTDLIRR